MLEQEAHSPTVDKRNGSKDDFVAYLTEGFQIPSQERLIRDRLIEHIPSIKTKAYRQSLLKIVSSLSQLDSFSNNMDRKVDCLLQAQESQFVESYRHHVDKIKQQFEAMNKQIANLQEKIRYYENEGEMSLLVKKVFRLEQQSAKLYQLLSAKDKRINDLELTIKVDISEMKRLQQGIKNHAREKSEVLWKSQNLREEEEGEGELIKLKDIVVFPASAKQLGVTSYQLKTEGSDGNTPKEAIGNSLLRKSVSVDVQGSLVQDASGSLSKSKKPLAEQQLQRENMRLKVKNKRLMSLHSKVTDSRGQFEQFFIGCVEELKRQIRIRKKMSVCSLEQFRKQDKLMLLIKILSNDEILRFLHEKIFGNGQGEGRDRGEKEVVSLPPHRRLPKLSFNLSYEGK